MSKILTRKGLRATRVLTYCIAAMLFSACHPSQGCSSWEDDSVAHVWIDDPNSEFSSDQLDVIEMALIEWSDAVDGHVTFEMVPSKGYSNLIVIRPDALENIKDKYGTSAVTDWVPWESGGGITAPCDVENWRFRLLMLHELGHALGLDHSEDPDVIMFGGPIAARSITCDDVKQFCEINDCNASDTAICRKLVK